MTANRPRKKQKLVTLSKTSRQLLDSFDRAAQEHGWDQDQGSPQTAINSEKAHAAAYAALEKRLLHLEQALKKARAKINSIC